jgi:hypothetical protein
MKITLFEQSTYRFLEDDFEQRHESLRSVPYSLVNGERMYESTRDSSMS